MPSDNSPTDLAMSLKSLENLDFGPKWSQPSPNCFHATKERRAGPKPFSREFLRGKGAGTTANERPHKPEAPAPRWHIQFFPEELPFKALCKAIRHSHKTYELFELARLVLEKPERFAIKVRRFYNAPPPRNASLAAFPPSGSSLPLYVSSLDEQVFESQEEALSHILKQHAPHFFQLEEHEVEGPKGQFPFIHCCGITGEPISPPNYHRYSELLQAHYKDNIGDRPGLSFERFLKSLKTEKSPEIQAAWLEKMKKQRCYRPLDGGDEAPLLASAQAAKEYLLKHYKDKALKEQSALSFSEKYLEKLSPSLRAAVREALAQQRDFPLDMANHIRSRLRHAGFCIYKKGAKGITYVSAIKRKRRDSTTHFSESIQKLIEFLEAHPLLNTGGALEQFLGLAPGQDLQAVAKEHPLIASTLRELAWLISEGYIVQYSDGRLEAVAPLALSEIGPEAKISPVDGPPPPAC